MGAAVTDGMGVRHAASNVGGASEGEVVSKPSRAGSPLGQVPAPPPRFFSCSLFGACPLLDVSRKRADVVPCLCHRIRSLHDALHFARCVAPARRRHTCHAAPSNRRRDGSACCPFSRADPFSATALPGTVL